METKNKLLKKMSLYRLGKIASQSLNKTKQSLNKTFQNLKKKRKEEISKKIKKEKIEQEKQLLKDKQQQQKNYLQKIKD